MADKTTGRKVLDGFTPSHSSTKNVRPDADGDRRTLHNLITRPYGGATVEERKAVMGARLTKEEIAKRNEVPTDTNPHTGEPLRVIAEEYFSENDTATHWKPEHPDDPAPPASEPLKPGVLEVAKKVTNRLMVKIGQNDPDYWGLATVMSEEEAELCSHMERRVPQTFEQLKRRAAGMTSASRPCSTTSPTRASSSTTGRISTARTPSTRSSTCSPCSSRGLPSSR